MNSWMNRGSRVLPAIAAMELCTWFVVPVLAGADPVIPLPREDREQLEKGLGPGVVGKAVPAPTIKDPAAFLGARKRSWKLRITTGDKTGKMEIHTEAVQNQS